MRPVGRRHEKLGADRGRPGRSRPLHLLAQGACQGFEGLLSRSRGSSGSPIEELRVRLPTSLSAEEGVVPCAPRLIGEPVVTLIGHEREGFNLPLEDREEEAVSLVGNLESSHRNDNALLSWREEAP